jgi:integrase
LNQKEAHRERMTLANRMMSPSPYEIYHELRNSEGWPYKTDIEYYHIRDRALVSLLYVGELRISEAIGLKLSQFEIGYKEVFIKDIQLSKRKPGKVAYRNAHLTLTGERAKFTKLILDYLNLLRVRNQERLFPFSLEKATYIVKGHLDKKGNQIKSVRMKGTHRAWEVVKAMLPNLTAHWLRAFGEDYLYAAWNKDTYAIAEEVQVDPRTLDKYLKKRSGRYEAA